MLTAGWALHVTAAGEASLPILPRRSRSRRRFPQRELRWRRVPLLAVAWAVPLPRSGRTWPPPPPGSARPPRPAAAPRSNPSPPTPPPPLPRSGGSRREGRPQRAEGADDRWRDGERGRGQRDALARSPGYSAGPLGDGRARRCSRRGVKVDQMPDHACAEGARDVGHRGDEDRDVDARAERVVQRERRGRADGGPRCHAGRGRRGMEEATIDRGIVIPAVLESYVLCCHCLLLLQPRPTPSVR